MTSTILLHIINIASSLLLFDDKLQL